MAYFSRSSMVACWTNLCYFLLALTLLPIAQAAYDINSDASIRKIPLRSMSLQAPYLDTDMQSSFFDFGDDTIIRADQYIRLTSDRQGQAGWLFGKLPMTATNWVLEIELRIHGQGHLHGDGMAIWLTEERAKSGQVFGSTENFNGLGIFIDTYKNGRPGIVFPYVMAMIGNSTNRYDKETDGRDQELAGCSARAIRSDHDDAANRKLRITYFQDTFLRLDIQYNDDNSGEWTECFETGPIVLPQAWYLGFSADTGEVTDNHDIIGVMAHNIHFRTDRQREVVPPGGNAAAQIDSKDAKEAKADMEKPIAHPFNPGGDHERAHSSWKWQLVKVAVFGIAVVGAYVGWTLFRASRRGRF